MKTNILSDKSPIDHDTKVYLQEFLVDSLKFNESIISQYSCITRFQKPTMTLLTTGTNLLAIHFLEENSEEIMRLRMTEVFEHLSQNINASVLRIKTMCLIETREFIFL